MILRVMGALEKISSRMGLYLAEEVGVSLINNIGDNNF